MQQTKLIFDFDQIVDWEEHLSGWIAEVVDSATIQRLAATKPKCYENALTTLTNKVKVRNLNSHLAQRFQGHSFRIYHGTRLTGSDVFSIKKEGIKPLDMASRIEKLEKAFSSHPNWNSVKSRLPIAIEEIGNKNRYGDRQNGRVYACFSRSGLLKSCTHYLAYGSEADQHVCSYLFGQRDGKDLLAKTRSAYLISFCIPFDEALSASNARILPENYLRPLFKLFLEAWAFRRTSPNFSPRTLKNCTALNFNRTIAPEEIDCITAIEDSEIGGET